MHRILMPPNFCIQGSWRVPNFNTQENAPTPAIRSNESRPESTPFKAQLHTKPAADSVALDRALNLFSHRFQPSKARSLRKYELFGDHVRTLSISQEFTGLRRLLVAQKHHYGDFQWPLARHDISFVLPEIDNDKFLAASRHDYARNLPISILSCR